jgi:hypothetical protein
VWEKSRHIVFAKAWHGLHHLQDKGTAVMTLNLFDCDPVMENMGIQTPIGRPDCYTFVSAYFVMRTYWPPGHEWLPIGHSQRESSIVYAAVFGWN